MIFGDLGGPKASRHLSYRWGKTPKNLTQETCPDRGSNPGPLHDKRACYHLLLMELTGIGGGPISHILLIHTSINMKMRFVTHQKIVYKCRIFSYQFPHVVTEFQAYCLIVIREKFDNFNLVWVKFQSASKNCLTLRSDMCKAISCFLADRHGLCFHRCPYS